MLIGNLETILEVEEEDAFEDCEDDVVQLQICGINDRERQRDEVLICEMRRSINLR